MSSGGKKTQTSSTTNNSGPPAWAQPYFEANLKQAGAYANQPYTPYTGQRVAGQNQMNPYASNAFADQQVGQLTGDITQNYQNGVAPSLMAQFNQGGAYGGSAHEQALMGSQNAFAHQLAEASTGIRSHNADQQYGEYNNMMGRNQAGLDANYQQYQDQQNYGANRIEVMSNALRGITGAQGSSSATGANPNYVSAGQNAASYAAILASMYGKS